MFALTRRADYAIRIMLELGDNTNDRLIPAAQIAQKADVPLAFLRKIVADLVKSGLVQTYSGPNGGLMLAQPVKSINLKHILTAIEGPICLNSCMVRPKECPRDHTCPAHGFLGRLQESIIQQLQDATLEKLVAEKRELEHHKANIKRFYPET